MGVYTRSGDTGNTGLIGGARVSKGDTRIEAIGSVDELNAVLGVALATSAEAWRGMAEVHELFQSFQEDLFVIGSSLALALDASDAAEAVVPRFPTERVAQMEVWIDGATGRLSALRKFILPGGTPLGAAMHHARAVCRRAERAVVRLNQEQPSKLVQMCMSYLNRLADLLFTAARLANAIGGTREVEWVPANGAEQAVEPPHEADA